MVRKKIVIPAKDNETCQDEPKKWKETRRKFLLDLQDTLDKERIHSLSDVEFKLAELDRQ